MRDARTRTDWVEVALGTGAVVLGAHGGILLYAAAWAGESRAEADLWWVVDLVLAFSFLAVIVLRRRRRHAKLREADLPRDLS